MDNDLVLKKYKRFLKDNGVFNRVMNVHLENARKKNLSLKEFLNKFNAYQFITNSDAFCNWSTTNEGRLFWFYINNKWKYKYAIDGTERQKKETGLTLSIFIHECKDHLSSQSMDGSENEKINDYIAKTELMLKEIRYGKSKSFV